MGRAIQPLKPIADAQEVADVIVATVRHPRRESFVDIARVLPALRAIAPGWIESYVNKVVNKHQFRDERVAPSPGNLFEPMMEGDDVSGGWRSGPDIATR
jgi:hypothetical protein